MAKFNRENNRSRGEGDKKDDDKKGGRSSYKAKRSFTRNKSYRDKEKEEPRRGARKPFGEREGEKRGDRPYPRKSGERREGDRPFRRERPGSGTGERSEERKPRGFDRRPDRDRERGRDNDDRSERVKSRERDNSGEERGGGDRCKRKKSSYRERGERSGRDGDRPARRSFRDSDERPARRSFRDGDDRPPRRERDGDDRPARTERNSDDRPARREREGEERGQERRSKPFNREDRSSRYNDRDKKEERPTRFKRKEEGDEDAPRRVKHSDFEEGRSFSKREDKGDKKPKPQKNKADDEGLIRLNKYLANAGLASRREADTLIQSGAVKVNGVVVDQLGYKIKPGDKVTYGDETVKGEKKVYLLLNKPKDYITTVDDPRDRKTVMELIKGACRERVYPVGRLDRNTTGILLFTNDGELTTKLTHPKFGVKKVYHVTLDKNIKTTDFKALVDGIELEDGPAKADDLAFVGEGKREVGIEIHSGRNRIVRRMFEHLGYAVVKLDRVVFAGLTKKDLPRGKHRFLTPKEVSFLKMIG